MSNTEPISPADGFRQLNKMLTKHDKYANFQNMAQPRVTFKAMLRQWRERKGLLQKEACEVLKIDLDTYRRWECGQTEPHTSPSMTEMLARLKEAE